ncbi:hypothetical protein ACFQJ5_02435 [Halomicroarcula sp. GCM10025324]|nr:hypothetical protein [Halomicroarcula sp. ZS-22-S1]
MEASGDGVAGSTAASDHRAAKRRDGSEAAIFPQVFARTSAAERRE